MSLLGALSVRELHVLRGILCCGWHHEIQMKKGVGKALFSKVWVTLAMR